ncbi:uncharacterized protein IL334_002377 [Kwoniella shivajii]|uniref:Ketoreductase domain-containing protein n=1 Tax=Kwoniella shivajii TaxID=564305 RepID=A0ABZ1CWA4_9TREE|nr:hypothetical protein IL334_002377 [Kwoniella shivajii]
MSSLQKEQPTTQDEVTAPPVSTNNRKRRVILDEFNLDMVIKIISSNIVSPIFVIFLPIILLSQTSSSHPAFIGSCIWTGLIVLLGICNRVDRVYKSGGNCLSYNEKLNWDEQIVLITGGGSGIGALLAETLAMRNVSVVVLTKDPPKIQTENTNIYTYICDVSDYKNVQTIAAKVREEVGDPTIIINNAGVVKGKLLLDLTEQDVRDTFGSNALAHFWILKEYLPAILKRGKGHIVTVSSVMGIVGAAQMTDYCASKAALISLNQSLRFELDNRYKTPLIRTTLILPSFIQTELFSKTIFPNSYLFKFFCPPLQPNQIVKSIVHSLDENVSSTIRLPFYTNAARFLGEGFGFIPCWLRDTIQHIAGADHAMRHYGPRPDAAEKLQLERERLRADKAK